MDITSKKLTNISSSKREEETENRTYVFPEKSFKYVEPQLPRNGYTQKQESKKLRNRQINNLASLKL